MAPPAKIWSSAACTLAIGERTSAKPSIEAAAVSEEFFMKEYRFIVTTLQEFGQVAGYLPCASVTTTHLVTEPNDRDEPRA
jgi:hypothetical protein